MTTVCRPAPSEPVGTEMEAEASSYFAELRLPLRYALTFLLRTGYAPFSCVILAVTVTEEPTDAVVGAEVKEIAGAPVDRGAVSLT